MVKIINETSFKKIKIVIIFLIAILTINTINVVNADQTITNTTSGGLKTAIDNVDNGQTVYLENGVYSGKDNTNLTITKNITIVGKGNNVVIDAKGISRIFTISHGVTVTLKNLKLINGKNTHGGAINNEGTLFVSDCTFTNNKATEFGGGAISNNYNLSVSSSTFTNNQAIRHGGAIGSYYTFSVSGSTFTNNQAHYGGAIVCSMANDNTIVHLYVNAVSNCTFTDNKATNYGGAIYNNYMNLFMTNSTFTNNQAKEGGAIYSNEYNISVNSCIFTNNQATSGGAIHTISSLSLTDCNFTNNQAKKDGGAIYVANMINNIIKDSILRIDSANFKNNIAGSKYNAIYLESGAKISKNKVSITPAEKTPLKADLTINKITKKGNYRHVTIKNSGKISTGKKFYLGVYVGKKHIKRVLVKTLGVGKSTTVKVLIPKKYKNSLKTFKSDSTNRIPENNKKNNVRNAR